jgi:DNA-binding beta-propeller fold protein YncE
MNMKYFIKQNTFFMLHSNKTTIQSLLLILLIGSTAFFQQSCKPKFLGIDLKKTLSQKEWEVREINYSITYHINERYDVPSIGSFREIDQSGDFQVYYTAEDREWRILNSYIRNENTSAGQSPQLNFSNDETIPFVYGNWKFNSTLDAPIVEQRYFDQGQECAEFALAGSTWDIVEEESGEQFLLMDFYTLAEDDFMGNIILYPSLYFTGNNPRLHPLRMEVLVDGADILLKSVPHGGNRRDTTFTSIDYGNVSIEENFAEVYVTIRLSPKTDEGCAEETCSRDDYRCENGALVMGVEGLCECQCEDGWQGYACDERVDFTWVSTIAGGKGPGYQDGWGTQALLDNPMGLTINADGNILIADEKNGSIRMIDQTLNSVSTFAGFGSKGYQDGPLEKAQFTSPQDIVYDPATGDYYVADAQRNQIRKISNGEVSTIAGVPNGTQSVDGPAVEAEFRDLTDLLLDQHVLRGHPVLLIADDNQIRLLDLNTMEVSTYAGAINPTRVYINGPANAAYFGEVNGMAMDTDGTLYVADPHHNAIRAISATGNREVTTYAGTTPEGRAVGLPANRLLNRPSDLVLSSDGKLYVTDQANNYIRVFQKVNGFVVENSVAGDYINHQEGLKDGVPEAALFASPAHITMDTDGNLYVADLNNHAIRRISQ